MSDDALINLENKSNFLKNKLTHEKISCGNYSFRSFKREILQILKEYKIHGSLFKAALNVGIDYSIVIDWYIQGQMGDPHFYYFYLRINHINDVANQKQETEKIPSECVEFDDEYIISQYGDGWSYKTYIDGEKIFIISNELETLKEKVKLRNLPLD